MQADKADHESADDTPDTVNDLEPDEEPDVAEDATAGPAVPSTNVMTSAAELLERLNAARCGGTPHVDVNLTSIHGAKKNENNDINMANHAVPSNKRVATYPDSSDDEQQVEKNKKLAKKTKTTHQAVAEKSKPENTTSPIEGKITLGEVVVGSMLAIQAPVAPELMPENASGRFVLVPASEFQCDSSEIAGWVAKIVKVDKSKKALTTIQFKDKKAEYFEFQYVKENFKPLTQPVTTTSSTKPRNKPAIQQAK